MNFEFGPTPIPLRVLMVNPLAPSSRLIMMKILSGEIFGSDQLIDMIMLVYSNEINLAESLRIDLISCAYACYNSIVISSNLPSLTDAKVFCFITNFPNPHRIDFSQLTTEHFDTFYLILKIAHHFSLKPFPKEEPEDRFVLLKNKFSKKPIRPIFVADGLATIDILYNVVKHIPADCLFCPTSIPHTAKAVLADHLKVTADTINEILVWAASNKVFYAAVVDPCITKDPVDMTARRRVWKTMSNEMLEKLEFDHTQFNATWLKKDYIEKIRSLISQNPFGTIYRGQMVFKVLKKVWTQRHGTPKSKYCNLGVISDGSLGTIKGCPYVLPLHFEGDTYRINLRFEETAILQNELKKMNIAMRDHHEQLTIFCKKFLKMNVIRKAFIPSDESSFSFSLNRTTTSSSSEESSTSQDSSLSSDT